MNSRLQLAIGSLFMTLTPIPDLVLAADFGADAELTLRSEVFANTRRLRITLPPSYESSPKRTYPVVYITDAIGVWHGMELPRVARELWAQGAEEAILVGIDNGGSTAETESPTLDRASEYLPYPDRTWTTPPLPEPRGGHFPRFLFDEVVPLIEAHYRVDPSPDRTGLVGASYGGAITLFTALERPDRLGCIVLLSPSLHVGDGQLLERARRAERWPRLYVSVGDAEGDTEADRRGMVRRATELRQIASRHLSEHSSVIVVHEGAGHDHDAWKRALPQALRFALRAKP